MRIAAMTPQLHLFVCANRRAPDSPLGPGCAEAGEAVFDALKEEVGSRRQFADIWVTKTHCLGVCPREGATVAVYRRVGNPCGRIFSEVHAHEARDLLLPEFPALRGGSEP